MGGRWREEEDDDDEEEVRVFSMKTKTQPVRRLGENIDFACIYYVLERSAIRESCTFSLIFLSRTLNLFKEGAESTFYDIFVISGHFGDSNCTTFGHDFLRPKQGAVLFWFLRLGPHS